MLGYDDMGLATVAHFGLDDRQSIWMVWALARAFRCPGEGYGDETIENVLDTIRGHGGPQAVMGRVHHQNDASKAMIEKYGFRRHKQVGDLEHWARPIGRVK